MPDDVKKLIILTAPSGAGKTSIAKYLLAKHPTLAFSVSATTRAPRINEQDGIDYHFLDQSSFKAYIEQDAFVEYEMVYEGVYYGTLKSELDRWWNLGKIPILDIDVKGAIHVQHQLGAASFSIFIMPPSLEALSNRLASRKTENKDSIQIRLDKAAYEMSFSDAFDAVVINEVLATACIETEKLILQFIATK